MLSEAYLVVLEEVQKLPRIGIGPLMTSDGVAPFSKEQHPQQNFEIDAKGQTVYIDYIEH